MNTAWDKSDRMGRQQPEQAHGAYRNKVDKWTQPGALADTVPNSDFVFTDFRYGGDTVKEVQLDPSVVQRWVDSPALNNGVMLVMLDAGHSTQILSVTDATIQGPRPMLSITYQVLSSGGVKPVAPSYLSAALSRTIAAFMWTMLPAATRPAMADSRCHTRHHGTVCCTTVRSSLRHRGDCCSCVFSSCLRCAVV